MPSKIEQSIAEIEKILKCKPHEWQPLAFKGPESVARKCKKCGVREVYFTNGGSGEWLRPGRAKRRAHEARASRPSVRINPKKSLSR